MLPSAAATPSLSSVGSGARALPPGVVPSAWAAATPPRPLPSRDPGRERDFLVSSRLGQRWMPCWRQMRFRVVRHMPSRLAASTRLSPKYWRSTSMDTVIRLLSRPPSPPSPAPGSSFARSAARMARVDTRRPPPPWVAAAVAAAAARAWAAAAAAAALGVVFTPAPGTMCWPPGDMGAPPPGSMPARTAPRRSPPPLLLSSLVERHTPWRFWPPGGGPRPGCCACAWCIMKSRPAASRGKGWAPPPSCCCGCPWASSDGQPPLSWGSAHSMGARLCMPAPPGGCMASPSGPVPRKALSMPPQEGLSGRRPPMPCSAMYGSSAPPARNSGGGDGANNRWAWAAAAPAGVLSPLLLAYRSAWGCCKPHTGRGTVSVVVHPGKTGPGSGRLAGQPPGAGTQGALATCAPNPPRARPARAPCLPSSPVHKWAALAHGASVFPPRGAPRWWGGNLPSV